MDITIDYDESGNEALRQAVLAPLVRHNDHQAGPGQWTPLALLLKDDQGQVIGGLWGHTGYGWLFTQLLAVPESHQGQGLGRRLLLDAEARALQRGCHGAWLDTFEFQARGFYEKLGYTCFGELPDYPPGFARYFMRKSIGPGLS
jgi:GNAT superfamily N-acetyltransferase